jgi:alpha-beta hydrolase superfamily lysophospholipase
MNAHRESIILRSQGVKLASTLFLPKSTTPSPVLIICHGAGEFKENYFELCEFIAEKGIASLAIDMHGHGGSGGERFHVKIQDWVTDIQAGVEFLSNLPRIDRDKIGAFGLSSGGTAILEAVLIEPRLKVLVTLDATVRNSLPLAQSLLMKSLIVLGTIKKWLSKRDLRIPLAKMSGGLHFASDPEIDRQIQSNPRALDAYNAFPLPGAAEAFFVNTLDRVAAITVPTLVLWGKDDELDPPQTAQMLFDALTCVKQLQIIPGNGHVGHLDRNRAKVFELTAQWVTEHLGLTLSTDPQVNPVPSESLFSQKSKSNRLGQGSYPRGNRPLPA